MASLNIKNIENVEGEYHLKFLEGKKTYENAKTDLRYAFFSLLLFITVVLVFILISGFNLFFVGFIVVYIVFFVAMLIYALIQKHKGKKECVYAVQNSRTEDIISKQVDYRGKILSDRKKIKQRKKRRAHLARILNQKSEKQD